jgi:hypothetical protein
MKDKIQTIGCEIIAVAFIILSVTCYGHSNHKKDFNEKHYTALLTKQAKKNNHKNL